MYNRRGPYRYRNPFRGLAIGLFFIFLAFAWAIPGHSGFLFLPLLFVGLAFASLLGSISSMNPRGIYGGMYSFVWLLGLALCFWIGFWPWILLPVGISILLGVFFNSIMAGLLGAGLLGAMQRNQQQPPYQQYQGQPPYQPYQGQPPYQEQPPQQEPYQPYQQGYQPPQYPGTYVEGDQQHGYPPEPKQQYEQPQTNYPGQQELPPQQQ